MIAFAACEAPKTRQLSGIKNASFCGQARHSANGNMTGLRSYGEKGVILRTERWDAAIVEVSLAMCRFGSAASGTKQPEMARGSHKQWQSKH
eukprot:1135728-Rhodomonas_salina.2